MTETHGAGAGRDVGQVEGDGPVHGGEADIDWVAAERSPEFRELVTKKKALVVPGTLFFLAWYFGFILLAGYAPDFMGEEFLTDGFTVGYALALTQFVMTWCLGWWYLRRPTGCSTRSPSAPPPRRSSRSGACSGKRPVRTARRELTR